MRPPAITHRFHHFINIASSSSRPFSSSTIFPSSICLNQQPRKHKISYTFASSATTKMPFSKGEPKKVVVNTSHAPAAIGPYSQAIHVGSTLYISGQLGLVPSTGDFKASSTADGHPVRAQTEQAMLNMGEILKAASGTFDHVVKTTILLVDMAHFPEVNDVYKRFFNEEKGYPARACYQVSALPKGGLVEIEAVAVLPEVPKKWKFNEDGTIDEW